MQMPSVPIDQPDFMALIDQYVANIQIRVMRIRIMKAAHHPPDLRPNRRRSVVSHPIGHRPSAWDPFGKDVRRVGHRLSLNAS